MCFSYLIAWFVIGRYYCTPAKQPLEYTYCGARQDLYHPYLRRAAYEREQINVALTAEGELPRARDSVPDVRHPFIQH